MQMYKKSNFYTMFFFYCYKKSQKNIISIQDAY